jgi:hypothetical protein
MRFLVLALLVAGMSSASALADPGSAPRDRGYMFMDGGTTTCDGLGTTGDVLTTAFYTRGTPLPVRGDPRWRENLPKLMGLQIVNGCDAPVNIGFIDEDSNEAGTVRACLQVAAHYDTGFLETPDLEALDLVFRRLGYIIPCQDPTLFLG